MRVVAIETATDRLSVAGGEPGGPIVARAFEGARRHAALLPGLVAEVMGELNWKWRDVEAVAVSDGPGSFTGLRVAASWAKGIWRAGKVELWTASTLLVRAAGAERLGTIFAYASALRGELYVAGYRFDPAGVIETVFPPTVLPDGGGTPKGVEADYLVGDASDLSRWPWAAGLDPFRGVPEARDLIGLIQRPGGAASVDNPAAWEPTYGRLAEAQAKWEKAHGQSLPNSARRTG